MDEEKKLGYLLFLVSRAHHNLASRVFKQIGLYRGQPQALFELGEREGLTQSVLSVNLEVTQATLTNILNRMEDSGLILRKRDSQDGRFSRIFLTDTGREKLTRAILQSEVKEKIAFDGFSDEERQQLTQFLNRIHTNLTR
jgi:DNA-binding MarR family transcriptional regulator